MKISARNSLKGTVKKIIPGVVSTEVTIEIAPGIEVVSVITKSSADNLHLTIGKEVYAVMKATEVMVAVES
ncbi:MAG: molybdopterin-binding protein [Calothrix sp. MO_192.B10]|nr:molybdopterin-binding protein [Calothrix sp. MO_192.B10]